MKLSEDRQTQIVMVAGFGVLYFVFDLMAFLYVCLGLSAIFITSSYLSKKVIWLWWKIGHALGWINTRILLSIVFYVFLLPISLLSKIFTKDPLKLKFRSKESLYSVRNHTYKAEDLENPW